MAARRLGVLPGDTRNCAPAAAACLGWHGVDDGAGTDDDVGHLGGDAFDGLQRGRCAQRQLDDRQAAVDERLGDRHRVGGVVHDDDRDDGDDVEQ